jgi:hypothetical protein
VGDLFDVPALRIRQPVKLLADRAKYEIFNAARQLLATAAETEGHTQRELRKTWAGPAKEILTPSDHYRVEFTGPVSQPTRTLAVMTAIALDLTAYGPI